VKRNQPVTVLLARFEDLISRGLRALIEEDESLGLIASDVPQASLEAALARHRPTVAILNFGSLSSAGDVRRIRTAFPETRLLVLGNHPSPAESRQLLAFGATACLSKGTQARDLISAIHLASRGLQVLPAAEPGRRRALRPELLTAREADVLELLHAGSSNSEIAAALHVSVETVRTHARHVYRKLGVSSRRELRTKAGG
jgi:DNA-binding NarL/FixJ family response regulator